MSRSSISINEKTVYVTEPYLAPVAELVGREHEMRVIHAAWLSGTNRLPLNPLLIGGPGVGKNRIVYECARLAKKQLYVRQCYDEMTTDDLVCCAVPSDKVDKTLQYTLGPLPTAMLTGGVAFLDGIGKLRAKALGILESVLDERRYIEVDLLGTRIHAHPAFRFIAGTNSSDLRSGRLPDFIRSRLRPKIIFNPPKKEDLYQIIRFRYREDMTPLLDQVWKLWDRNKESQAPTPRDFIQIFDSAQNYADLEDLLDSNGKAGWVLENKKGPFPIYKRHVRMAFEGVYEKGDMAYDA